MIVRALLNANINYIYYTLLARDIYSLLNTHTHHESRAHAPTSHQVNDCNRPIVLYRKSRRGDMTSYKCDDDKFNNELNNNNFTYLYINNSRIFSHYYCPPRDFPLCIREINQCATSNLIIFTLAQSRREMHPLCCRNLSALYTSHHTERAHHTRIHILYSCSISIALCVCVCDAGKQCLCAILVRTESESSTSSAYKKFLSLSLTDIFYPRPLFHS